MAVTLEWGLCTHLYATSKQTDSFCLLLDCSIKLCFHTYGPEVLSLKSLQNIFSEAEIKVLEVIILVRIEQQLLEDG